MTDKVTISRECAEAFLDGRTSDVEINFIAEMIAALQSSPPPPSGLREALNEAADKLNVIGLNLRGSSNKYQREDGEMALRVAKMCEAALAASPDDGWVKVDEAHPLPSDLKENDEVRHVAGGRLEYRRRSAQGG